MGERVKVVQSRIREGVWEGLLSGAGAAPPALEVTLGGRVVEGLTLSPLADEPGSYALRFAIPATTLCEGAQTFLITERGRSHAGALAHFTILTGLDSGEDLRAEVDLLRAELDLLKKAFRRHCLETGASG